MNRKTILIGIAIALLVVLILHFAYKPEKFYFDPGGRAHYPASRGQVEFSEERISEDADYSVFRVIYSANGTDVYSKLWLPKTAGKHGAVLFLPGAGGTKDAGIDYAEMFRGKGIAVMAIDQRGFGESKEVFAESIDAEYDKFMRGAEPMATLMVFDALRAFDYLNQKGTIDRAKIVVLGESMGGRNAIIAAAIEPRFKMGEMRTPPDSSAHLTRTIILR